MKFKDQPDPFDQIGKLWGLRPGVQEQVQHTAHTQVEVPRRQAILAMQVRLATYLGVAMFFIFALAVGWLLSIGLRWLAALILSIDIVLLLAGVAWRIPRSLLLQRMEKEIVDPYHDDTMREIAESFIAHMQPPPAEVQIKREITPYKAYQNGQPIASEQEPIAEPSEFEDLLAFTQQAAIRGLARDTVWCVPNQDRIRLYTGTIVTRSKWRQFCELLMGWGLVKQDNKGYIWVNGIAENPQKAVEYLMKAKRDSEELWEPDEPIP